MELGVLWPQHATLEEGQKEVPVGVSFPFKVYTLLYLMLGLPYQNAISWVV